MMNHDKEKYRADQVANLFQKAREIELEPSPYFETRVLASCRLFQRQQSHIMKWRFFGLVSSCAAALLLILFLSQTENGVFKANIHKAVAVRVTVEQAPDQMVAFAQVDLPEGVYFYSKRYPGLREQRRMRLPAELFSKQKELPFVVMAENSGKKTVRVSFFDSNDNFLYDKRFNINFIDQTQIDKGGLS
jgi:hypothetical protein